jgi:hypothetical protein
MDQYKPITSTYSVDEEEMSLHSKFMPIMTMIALLLEYSREIEQQLETFHVENVGLKRRIQDKDEEISKVRW